MAHLVVGESEEATMGEHDVLMGLAGVVGGDEGLVVGEAPGATPGATGEAPVVAGAGTGGDGAAEEENASIGGDGAAEWHDEGRMLGALRSIESWTQQCSKHLSHSEARQMEAYYLGHEIMRQFMIRLEAFSPPPRGDWGWGMRRMMDIAVKGVRQLRVIYWTPTEGMSQFLQRAMRVVRLYLEVAFFRTLMGAHTGVLRASYCGLMLTWRNFEVDTLGDRFEDMFLFSSFTEEAVRRMAEAHRDGTDYSLRVCPSYEAVSNMSDMKVEIMSLAPVMVSPMRIEMHKNEVRTLIEANGGELEEGEEVPGQDGLSVWHGVNLPRTP